MCCTLSHGQVTLSDLMLISVAATALHVLPTMNIVSLTQSHHTEHSAIVTVLQSETA